MNDHYNRAYNPPTGTRVSSSDLINEFQAVQGGFDSTQAELENTLRQASGTPIAALPNAVSRALKALAFDADGNPVAVQMVLVTDAVARTGDTMLGPLILSGAPTNPLQAATKQYVDKPTQTITANTTAVAGIRYLIAANGITLTAPTGQSKGDYFGFRLLSGITGAVVDFGATKLRGATPGAMTLDIDPGPVDLNFEDSTMGYI